MENKRYLTGKIQRCSELFRFVGVAFMRPGGCTTMGLLAGFDESNPYAFSSGRNDFKKNGEERDGKS